MRFVDRCWSYCLACKSDLIGRRACKRRMMIRRMPRLSRKPSLLSTHRSYHKRDCITACVHKSIWMGKTLPPLPTHRVAA